jgi:hypothetical protein
MEESDQIEALAALGRRPRYPLHMRVDGPQSPLDLVQKIITTVLSESRTAVIQLASSYFAESASSQRRDRVN